MRILYFLLLLLVFVLPASTFAYSTNMNASIVVGQTNFTSNSANQGGSVGSAGMEYPEGMTVIGGKLVVSDFSNNRVLVYNTIPTSNNASANVVIGQSNFTNNSANQGGSAAASTLRLPGNVCTNGTKLIIVDQFNNRLLVYNTAPTVNNASADVVIGQPDMTTTSGATTATKMNFPFVCDYDTNSGKLAVTDSSNHRILIYNSIPTSNGASADLVVGQSDFTSTAHGTTASLMNYPVGVRFVQNKLIAIDGNNHRVLIWNSIPTSNGTSADVVIGQSNFTSGVANQGGSVGPQTMYFPVDVAYDGIDFFVEDNYNNRILIFNGIPTSNNASAYKVLGQPDLTSNNSNQGGSPGANKLSDPNGGLKISGSQLFVGDSGNNRVLIFNNDATPTPTPSPTLTPTPTTVQSITPTPTLTQVSVSSAGGSSYVPNPNIHENWVKEVMAGPDYVGEVKFITDVNTPGAATLIAKDATHDPLYISLVMRSPTYLSSLLPPVPFPWSQGLNTVGEIYEFQALSAFNGYPIPSFDKPVTIVVPYDPLKLHGRNPTTLRILYFDKIARRWKVMQNNTVLDMEHHTLANTTKSFTYFAVGYSSGAANSTSVLGASTSRATSVKR